MSNWGIPFFSKKWRYMVATILNCKKQQGEFLYYSAFVWGDVQVSLLKKSSFCNFIPGLTLMLLHYGHNILVQIWHWFTTFRNENAIFYIKFWNKCTFFCILSLGKKLNYDRFVDPNIVGAALLVHSDLRIYRISFFILDIKSYY